MAIPVKVVEVGAKTVVEVAKKAYDAGAVKGFVMGAKWVGKLISPIGAVAIKAVTKDGLPNKELRTVGSMLLNLCKKIKHL